MTLRVAQFDQKIEFDYFNETAYTPQSRYHDDLRSVMVPYLVVAALFEAFKSKLEICLLVGQSQRFHQHPVRPVSCFLHALKTLSL